jgi:hypothetical protein
MQPQDIRHLLMQWKDGRTASGVSLVERIPPEDPYARYSVVFESVFEPDSIQKARLEVWTTSDAHVGLGFETWRRIASRLGVRGGTDRFAAGHEPRHTTPTGLLAVLDAIADGEIAIEAVVVPVVGLVSTRAVAAPSVVQRLASRGYDPATWLSTSTSFSRMVRRMVRFAPW